MKIHEYQAKALFRQYGVPVPDGRVCASADEAAAAAIELGGTVVVKAQIHAGGRGKGGGVKVVKTPDEARAAAAGILGKCLVTHQTGPAGKEVLKVLVEKGSSIAKELYLSLLVDRASHCLAVIASREGGMDIEHVAATNPAAIHTVRLDPGVGYSAFVGRDLAKKLGLASEQLGPFATLLGNLVRLFLGTDASMVEINPLITTAEGALVALDGKVTFDDNASFRHKELLELRDLSEEDPREIEASKHDLNYIKLDGEVGCMVNGAGLAMGTMDIIKHVGGEPANFLDVGGGANAERVEAGFHIILSDPNVKAILVNIFGGIVRCDRVAGGVIEAVKKVGLKVPVVVRLAGTNHEEAAEMLRSSGIDLIVAHDLQDAAVKVVNAARGN